MADTFTCPQCGVVLRRSPALKPGVRVKCPKCTQQFAVPDLDVPPLPSLTLDPSPPPPPAAPRRDEAPAVPRTSDPFAFEEAGATPRRGGADFAPEKEPLPRKRREPDDDYEDDDDRPRTRAGRDDDEGYDDQPIRRDEDPDKLTADYKVNISAWFEVATANWSAILGPTVGYLVLAGLAVGFVYILAAVSAVALISMGIPPVLAPFLMSALILIAPLLQGTPIVALYQVLGQRWEFGTFFSGFQHYTSLLGLAFFQGVLYFVCMLPLIGTQVAFGVGLAMTAGGGGPGASFGAMALLLLPLGYLILIVGLLVGYTKLFTFAFPLVVMRRFGPIEAMRGSWQLSEGKFWPLLGFNALTFLIMGAGGFACFFGYLFTIPLGCLLQAAAYATAMHLSVVRPDQRDDDYDDRPRRRSRRRDDDYDDEDDRPRRRSRRSEEDVDDRPRRPRADADDDY